MKNPGYLRPFLNGGTFLYGVGDNPRTLCELAMCRLSAEFRSRTEWWTLYHNQDTRQQWLEHALSRRWDVYPSPNNLGIGLTRRQIEFVLDELAGYAILRDENNGAQVSCFDRIWESDSLINSTEHANLLNAINHLRQNDLGSVNADAVRDILDPCRYSLIYGRTYALPPPLAPPQETDDYCLSTRFACLPTDLSVSSDGLVVKSLSYINGVDPAHQEAYRALETTLKVFISLFENVLTDLHRNNPLPQRIKGPCRYQEWDEPDPPEDSDDEEGWIQFRRDVELWELNRPIQIPDIPENGYVGDLPHRNMEVNLRGRHIQAIFKVTDFHLTPDVPEVPATDWHVEGMKNERIVACALYVCSMENIIDSNIAFRMAVTSPRGFSAGDVGATFRTWGMRDGDLCNQFLGSVPLRAGLSIVFPNIYQHHLTAMRLAESSQEGRMTVVSIFLVDPDAPPVVSTARVAPQQYDWIRRALQSSFDKRLPNELIEKIMSHINWLLIDEDADSYAQEMREEREFFCKLNDDNYFSLPFDIWIGN